MDEEVPSLLARAESRAGQTVEWFLDNDMVLSLHNFRFIVQAMKELRRTRNMPKIRPSECKAKFCPVYRAQSS